MSFESLKNPLSNNITCVVTVLTQQDIILLNQEAVDFVDRRSTEKVGFWPDAAVCRSALFYLRPSPHYFFIILDIRLSFRAKAETGGRLVLTPDDF
jgi:hypothetical protein